VTKGDTLGPRNGHSDFSDGWLWKNQAQPVGFFLDLIDGKWIVRDPVYLETPHCKRLPGTDAGPRRILVQTAGQAAGNGGLRMYGCRCPSPAGNPICHESKVFFRPSR
jgi:hypothetical protein